MKGVFVGLTTLDLIQYVEAFPQPDEKIQAEDRWIGAGGPAANAAIAFAALGGEAELVTALGSSLAAQMARQDLEESSVSVRDLAAGGELAISNIVVDASGRRTVVSVNGAGFASLSGGAALGDDVDVVLADGHHVAGALPLLQQASELGCHTVFDGGSRKSPAPRSCSKESSSPSSPAPSTPSATPRKRHGRCSATRCGWRRCLAAPSRSSA